VSLYGLPLRHCSQENLDLFQALSPFVPSDSPAGPAALVAAPTDFSSHAALKGVFVTHDVDTVISALGLYGEDWRVEENLLWAAVDAGARRFAPSSWEAPVEWSVGSIIVLLSAVMLTAIF
jgi:hypothetical protein